MFAVSPTFLEIKQTLSKKQKSLVFFFIKKIVCKFFKKNMFRRHPMKKPYDRTNCFALCEGYGQGYRIWLFQDKATQWISLYWSFG